MSLHEQASAQGKRASDTWRTQKTGSTRHPRHDIALSMSIGNQMQMGKGMEGAGRALGRAVRLRALLRAYTGAHALAGVTGLYLFVSWCPPSLLSCACYEAATGSGLVLGSGRISQHNTRAPQPKKPTPKTTPNNIKQNRQQAAPELAARRHKKHGARFLCHSPQSNAAIIVSSRQSRSKVRQHSPGCSNSSPQHLQHRASGQPRPAHHPIHCHATPAVT